VISTENGHPHSDGDEVSRRGNIKVVAGRITTEEKSDKCKVGPDAHVSTRL
jgi:hypothetical protein